MTFDKLPEYITVFWGQKGNSWYDESFDLAKDIKVKMLSKNLSKALKNLETLQKNILPKRNEIEKNAKQYGVTVLLKGSTDVISDGKKTFLYTKKIPAMTVGGTGDVLSGLTAGILAKNRSPLESATAATFINGLAGMAVQKKLGLHMTSMDLLDEIPHVMKPFDKIV